MEYVAGFVTIDDVDGFLDTIRAIGERHGCAVQAIDARYVAGERHLEKAWQLATRERNRGEAIAEDPGLEWLLYAAGTRQLNRAFDLGVTTGENRLVIVVWGENESDAIADIAEEIVPIEGLPEPDADRLVEWFDISRAEREATAADLEALVCERVALLTVDR